MLTSHCGNQNRKLDLGERFGSSAHAVIGRPYSQFSQFRIMKILLYNPDNGVTRNFMPHLWMFLLQALTPPGHEVLLIDGNAQPMDEDGIARVRARTEHRSGGHRRDDPNGRKGVSHGGRGSRRGSASGDGRPARYRRWRMRRLGAMAARAMRMRWRLAKPMRPGRRSWKMRRAASSKKSTRRWTSSGKSASRRCRHIRRFPGTRSNLDQFNLVPKVMHPLLQARGRRLGNISHYSDGVRARLPLRLRVLHGHRIFR